MLWILPLFFVYILMKTTLLKTRASKGKLLLRRSFRTKSLNRNFVLLFFLFLLCWWTAVKRQPLLNTTNRNKSNSNSRTQDQKARSSVHSRWNPQRARCKHIQKICEKFWTSSLEETHVEAGMCFVDCHKRDRDNFQNNAYKANLRSEHR